MLSMTPAFLKSWIIHQWKSEKGIADGNYLISFSQQAEDLHIDRFFNGRSSGFYVDIGAFDPVVYSNTLKFYQRGWRGINIEPNPDLIQKIRTHRPADINLNVAISDTCEKLSYYRFESPALNSFSEAHVADWAGQKGFKQVDVLTLPTRLLSDVLDEYLPADTAIDFMSVDVEGWDLKVLSSNNWKRYRPTLLLVEFEYSLQDQVVGTSLYSFLRDHGYEIWTISGNTAFFIDRLESIR